MAPVEAEVGLLDPAGAQFGRNEGDRLGASVGQQQAVVVDAKGGRHRRRRLGRVRVASEDVQMGGDHRGHFRRDRVEAG